MMTHLVPLKFAMIFAVYAQGCYKDDIEEETGDILPGRDRIQLGKSTVESRAILTVWKNVVVDIFVLCVISSFFPTVFDFFYYF